MKTVTVIILLLFTFFTCAAPELSSELKVIEKNNSMNWLTGRTREREYGKFIEHLKFKESSGIWTMVNGNGCIGLYQFSQATLRFLGYKITPAEFKKDPGIFPPELQEKVLKTLISANEIQLQGYMAFIGKTIGGILITRSGMLAGAHLGGVMGVEMYLSSGGNVNFADSYGTSIRDYLKEFQGYDI